MMYKTIWYLLAAEENATGDRLAHLKLVKAEQGGFIAYLHGNWRYRVIGEQFPQRPFWKALFPLVDPCKQYTNVRHGLKNTCIDKPG